MGLTEWFALIYNAERHSGIWITKRPIRFARQ